MPSSQAEMTPPALGPEIFTRGFRFNPTPQEAVSYYLPRLIAGEPLHEVVRSVIHHADIYPCEPAELARRFRPMPKTGDRFFFAPCCKKQKASTSSWAAQTTTEIKDAKDVQIGVLRKLRYKNRGVLTDWLMDECSPSCGGGDGQQHSAFVFCKVYVSPRAAPTSAAHHESAAFFALPQLPPATPAAVITHRVTKRTTAPPPPQAAMPTCAKWTTPPPQQAAMPPCAKRTTPPPQAATKRTTAPPPPPQAAMPTCAKWTTPPPQQAAMPPCAKRTAPPPQAAMPPCAKRVRVPVAQPAPPAPITSPLTAVRKLYFAPPQPCAPLYGSLAPNVTRTQPSPALLQAPALPVLTRPVMPAPLARPMQQVLLPTPPVIQTSYHMPPQAPASAPCQPQVSIQSKQTRILDPFEAAILRDAEEQTVAAAPATLQDDDDDDLVKALEEAMSTVEAEEQTMAPALQDEDEDDWDDLDNALGLEE